MQMAHCLVNGSFGNFSGVASKTPSTEVEALKEEIKNLQQKLKSNEKEHVSVKGFLEQKIEFLEDQINSYKEREENIKKMNQSVMSALEEMGKQDAKHGLKIKAFEELEKASLQYNHSLFEMKIRMREEMATLQIENKKLQEECLEKDHQLKVLKQFIEDIRDGYISMKPTVIINSISSPRKGGKEWEEFWEKLDYERIMKTAKGQEDGVLRLDDEDNFYARSCSQPLETAASEQRMQYLTTKMTSSKSELQPEFNRFLSDKGISKESHKSPRELGQNQLPSLAYLLSPNSVSPRDQETNRKALSTIEDKQTRESVEDQQDKQDERRFQAPKNVFSVSTLTLNSEIMRATANDQYPPFDAPDSHTIIEEKPMFSQRKVDEPREKIVLKDFWRSKNSSMEQHSGYFPKDMTNVSGAAEILDIVDYDGDQYNLFTPVEKSPNLDRNSQFSPGFCDESEYNTSHRIASRRHSNIIGNFENGSSVPGPQIPLSRHVRSRNISGVSGRPDFLDYQDDDRMTETKYMMGRLLKVKRKLDKKSIEINASISQGYEYSQMNMSNLTKKSISEPQFGRETNKRNVMTRRDSDLMLHALAMNTRSNMNTPRQTNYRNQMSGPREDFYYQKSYR